MKKQIMANANNSNIIIRQLGLQDYMTAWRAMQQFTQARNADTLDEIWLLEHPPVFTQGQNGKAEHVLAANHIPVIQSDRGGQVTYHGPGQLIAYTLIDLKRKQWHTRKIVNTLEETIIQLLKDYQITAYSDPKAPGVYVDQKKMCSIGLRIRRGCTFHGLALNIAMDLTPFLQINPCGFHDLEMTQMRDFYPDTKLSEVQSKLADYLIKNLAG